MMFLIVNKDCTKVVQNSVLVKKDGKETSLPKKAKKHIIYNNLLVNNNC